MYGLFLILAAFAAWLMCKALSKIKKGFNYSDNDISSVYLIAICGAVAGSYLLRPVIRLVGVVLFWERYNITSVIEFFNYLFGEIVFYGGFLGGLIAAYLFCRKYKIKIIPLFDLFAPPLALGHAIGRIGCFFGGCCYGIEMPHGHPLAVIYPPVSLGAPSGISLLAVPLIEAAFLLILSLLLTVIFLKSKHFGISSSTYLLAYPIGRFTLEFFRGDIIRGNYGFLTTSQFISIGIFIFGVLYIMRIKRNGVRHGKNIMKKARPFG